MARPTPYITRQRGDRIQAEDWNEIQIQAKENIQSHDHTGGVHGVQISSHGIAAGSLTSLHIAAAQINTEHLQNGAVTAAKIAPAAITNAHVAPDTAFPPAAHQHHGEDLTVGNLRIGGNLQVQRSGAFTGHLGIGTTEPKAPLEVQSVDANTPAVVGLSTPNAADFIALAGGCQAHPHPQIIWRRGALRLGTADSFDGQDWVEKLRITEEGHVGIGTPAPREALEVQGNIRLGPGGSFYALAALHNVRVLVGKVLDNGAKLWGDGFRSQRTDTGQYHIDFDAPFVAAPVVIAGCTDTNTYQRETVGCENVSTTGFDVRVWRNTDNRWEDDPFDFIVIGLQ